MKQYLTTWTTITLLLVALAGCGRFTIEGQVVMEMTPTPSIAAGAAAGATSIEAADGLAPAPAPTTTAPRLPRFGLAEFLLLTGALVAASVVLGAYLLLTGRPQVFDARPMEDAPAEPATLRTLLGFRPNARGVLLSLSAWTFTLGMLAVVIIGGLTLLVVPAGQSSGRIALTVPSSIMIENGGANIRLPLDDLTCALSADADWERLRCDMPLAGQSLTLDVLLTAGTFWDCTAVYGDRAVPCRATFDDGDYQTFIVLDGTLGLRDDQLRTLANSQPSPGMTEARWLWLAQAAAVATAAVAGVGLWRSSRRRSADGAAGAAASPDAAPAAPALRAVYAVIVSVMVYGVAYYVTLLSLLLLGAID